LPEFLKPLMMPFFMSDRLCRVMGVSFNTWLLMMTG
jgi:hypothetical protein